jgi:DNA mismatch repair protein MLH1
MSITPDPLQNTAAGYLRNDISNSSDEVLTNELRSSSFHSVLSPETSIIQCNDELREINHDEFARELFYQLSVKQIKTMQVAKLGTRGLDVMKLIHRRTSATRESARQATALLHEHSSMLGDCFSLKFEVVELRPDVDSLFITDLPILLDGHVPQLHGLPDFLLRLATEVNFSEERACYEGICHALAEYYSEFPLDSCHVYSEDDYSEDEYYIQRLRRYSHTQMSAGEDFMDEDSQRHMKRVIFPGIKLYLDVPQRFSAKGIVMQCGYLIEETRTTEGMHLE